MRRHLLICIVLLVTMLYELCLFLYANKLTSNRFSPFVVLVLTNGKCTYGANKRISCLFFILIPFFFFLSFLPIFFFFLTSLYSLERQFLLRLLLIHNNACIGITPTLRLLSTPSHSISWLYPLLTG